jgi:hypothetical protein
MINAASDAVLHSPAYVRDLEARITRLSPCVLASADRHEITHATFTPDRLELAIPDLATAAPMEVPDDRWQGWEWSANEFLLLHVDPHPEFAVITHPGRDSCRLTIVGRPMQVRRMAPGDPGWAARAYAAEVTGYLNDDTFFWGQVVAPTEPRRETLLAGLATLERTSTRA